MPTSIETMCEPESIWDAEAAEFHAKFTEPITINIERVCFVRPGMYPNTSVISVGGPAFLIDTPYEIMRELMQVPFGRRLNGR